MMDKNSFQQFPQNNPNYTLPFTYNSLKQIQTFCDSLHVPVLFFHIPHVSQIENEVLVQNTYTTAFKDLPMHYAAGIKKDDHVSQTGDTHFNNRGHAKFKKQIEIALDSLFKSNSAY